MTESERRPSRQDGAPPSTISGRRHSTDMIAAHNIAIAVVAAVLFPPSPGRRLTLAIVTCPFCSTGAVTSVHAHRGVVDGSVRNSACRRGRYRLRVASGVIA